MGRTENSQSVWMNSLGKKDLAVHFVRDTLGCACPDEVFNHYQILRGRSEHGPYIQLVMGDRLLVKIIEMSELSLTKEAVLEMLSNGVEERERRRLNRFRLVIVADPSPEIQKKITELSNKMDSRVHIHIISPDAMAF
ncbi:hypothetical protein ACFL2O_05600 [Thermodesulfobacteriota bacterium]